MSTEAELYSHNERGDCAMRKLTVKNFSVIEQAELEFGRVTVLIGPQSSGKSLLSKLAYFLGGEIIGMAVESLAKRDSWNDFIELVGREFRTRFSTLGWLRTSSRASFSSERYSVELRGFGDPLNPDIAFTFSDDFRQLYASINENASKHPSYPNLALSELRQDLWVALSLALNGRRTQSNIYIPSGRAFFTDAARSVAALQNPDLDPVTRRFASLVPWDTKWKIGLLTTGQNVVREIEKEMYRIVGGVVIADNGKPIFLAFDGRSLPLSMQSSGTQELLPMLNLLNYLAFHQDHFYARATATKIPPEADVSDYSPLIYLEEPESHVFPDTQRDLIQLFAWLASDPILSFDWVITTHSPYVLSVLGDLVKAGKVGAQSAAHHAATAKVIPEKYWIKEGDFAAYKIANKRLVSIFDKTSGQIDGDYLDNVSGKISEEFGQLLEIQYGG
jgi:hypothetical protein